MSRALTIGNCLPRTLSHYLKELEATLSRVGTPFELDNQLPSAEGASKTQKAQYFAYLTSRYRRNSESNYFQVWPATGLLEALFMDRWKAPSYVIIHDPTPLRHQFGFGKVAHSLAEKKRLKRVTVVNHTNDAYSELRSLYPHAKHVQMLHPILSEQQIPEKEEGSVLVAGQFKPARDLDLLSALGPQLRRRGFHPKIVGPGWPRDIPGWDVTDSFLSEEELSNAIGRAGALCIPYRRYFQSNILVRGLEMGTLGVSPKTSFANDVLGNESALIVNANDSVGAWVESIEAALQSGNQAASRFAAYKQACDQSWTAGLCELG
ncbi:MAG: hypothetical protein LBM94_05305 [Propionibacteriaceae bacterium]|jgi:hypothetical protein|nr:hypothetical protein [Propionibacteriaceae bacterium]